MSKKVALIALAASTLLSTSLVFAQNPTSILVTVTCPGTQTPTNVITNFKTYIAGYGVEQIDQNPMTQVYFVGPVQNDTPPKLTGFINNGVDYDSTTGQIDCKYSQPGFTNLVASYTLTNNFGGIVQSNTQNSITIAVPVGLK